MNVLVLGGNGYLGSKIVKKLLLHNNNVYCTVRDRVKISRLSDIVNDVCFIEATYKGVNDLFLNKKIDYIINTVCDYGKKGNQNVIEANLIFPLSILELAARYRVENFLTIGTALPVDLNIYSFTKNSFSEYGKYYSEKYDINFIDLRVEMFYGADEPQDRFIPSVIHKMIKGDVVNTTIGTQKRDIIAVEDVVNWIMLIVNGNLIKYSSFDLGTGIAPEISELIDFVWNKTGRKSIVNKGTIPMRLNEPDCIADISKISSLVAYEPIYWKDGISRMIEEIRRDIR